MAERDQHVPAWDAKASRYDSASAWVERRFLRDGRSWATARAAGRVLDVGIGTGANLAHLSGATSVTGVDPSTAMLALAGEKAAGQRKQVDLHSGFAEELPFDDDSFDSVLITYVLCNVDDVAQALRETGRVLRPGGSLLVADHVVSTRAWVRWGQRAVERVTGPWQGEWLTRRPRLVLDEDPAWRVVDAWRGHKGVIEALEARRAE